MHVFKSMVRARVLGFVALAVFTLSAACADSPGTGVAEQAVGTTTVTTGQPSYTDGQTITVNWTGTPGATNDWIALVPAGSPPDSGFLQWTFTNGAVDGSHDFSGMQDGSYEARAYAGGSYTVLATSTFSVGPGSLGTVTVSTDKTIYAAQQPGTITYAGMPGNVDDWVAVVVAGSPANSGFVQFYYTNGQVNGTQAFNGLIAGNYEARAYQAGTYNILGSSTFSVTDLSTDQAMYAVNQPVLVTWTNLPGNATDYVSINTAGSPPDSGFIAQFTTGGAVTGSHSFAGLPAGSYEARSYINGTFTMVDSVAFTVAGSGPPQPTVTTDHPTYVPGQSIVASWANLPGQPGEWIAVFPAGSPANSGFLQWFYTNTPAGMQTFNGLDTGDYEVRLYAAGSYTILASATFTVGSGGSNTCIPPTNPPVVSGVTSGTLTLDATQNINTVALASPLATSILFTSVSEDEPSPAYGAVMCDLHDVDMTDSLPAGVTCRRATPGTDGTSSGVITISYTVVTFSSGVSVQRGVANTGFGDPVTVTLTTVDPTQSFVLLGGILTGGTGWGNNEFMRAQLVDGSTLQLKTFIAGSQVAWQVVTMSGASVQRGSTTFASADTSMAVTLTNAAPSGSMVLASYTTDNTGGIAASTLMLQSALTDPTTVTLMRDAGGSNLDVSWEVVSLPFATIAGSTSFTAGQLTTTAPVAGIAAATSVAFCSSQSILGPSTGSTSYAGSDIDLVGEAAVTLTTGAGSVTLTRGTSQADAEIPWTVIDFAHNCAGQ